MKTVIAPGTDAEVKIYFCRGQELHERELLRRIRLRQAPRPN